MLRLIRPETVRAGADIEWAGRAGTKMVSVAYLCFGLLQVLSARVLPRGAYPHDAPWQLGSRNPFWLFLRMLGKRLGSIEVTMIQSTGEPLLIQVPRWKWAHRSLALTGYCFFHAGYCFFRRSFALFFALLKH